MTFALFLIFTTNIVLRLNDFLPGFRGFPLAEIMIPLLVALWILFEKKDFTGAPDYLLPSFYLLMVVTFAITVWEGGAIMLARGYLAWVLLYFLAANLVRTNKRMDYTFAALLAASLVLVFHSVQQVQNWDGVTDESGVGFSGATVQMGRIRYVGVMNDPNDLALFFAMMLPLALQLSAKGMNLFKSVAGYFVCLPLVYGIILSNSRGGMLACGGVAALFTYRRWGIVKAGVLCLALAMAALTFGPSRLREENESDEHTTQGRIHAWHAGFEIFKKHPITGCGVGEFTEYHHLTAHNSFVLCFAETGFVGYLLWLGTGAYAMYGLYVVMTRTRPGTRSYRQAVGLFDSLAAFYVGGFFLSRTYFLLLPVLLGLAVARYKMTRDELSELQAEQAASGTLPNGEPSGDFLPDPEPIPDLSWRSVPRYTPKLVGLALASMVLINLIVRIKLARG